LDGKELSLDTSRRIKVLLAFYGTGINVQTMGTIILLAVVLCCSCFPNGERHLEVRRNMIIPDYKNIFLKIKNLIWILSILLTLRASGQVKRDTLYSSTNDLIGVWQRNFKEAGKGLLYFTIKSRVVTEGGKIAITESSEIGYIFHITGGTRKEIAELDPQESCVPIYINGIKKGKIMLDNETYYKMTRDDLKNEGIKGAF